MLIFSDNFRCNFRQTRYCFLTNLPAYALAALLLMGSATVKGQKIKFASENQNSTWVLVNDAGGLQYQAGNRFIPSLTVTDSLDKGRKLDAEISVNAYGSLLYSQAGSWITAGNIKPYRLWLRYAAEKYEVRLGLQKINFGSASMLRPLMWFDRMDYRDPLMLTDGVYGLLGRYYFANNANLWLWVLYGNHEAKGLDPVPTFRRRPEAGGRLQLPVPKGEIAVSFHHRDADFDAYYDSVSQLPTRLFPENKIGFDGKFDIGPGLCYEFVLKHNAPGNRYISEWETFLNLGIDYTFSLGNGLTVSAEYFRYNSLKSNTQAAKKSTFTTLAAAYPFGLMNTMSTVVYYNRESRQWFRFVSLQRKYDYWSFHIMGYWNPETQSLFTLSGNKNLFAGKGIQLMAVVNF